VRVRESCERDELVLMVVGPRWKNLDDLETPCPEYLGLRSEYPGRVLHCLGLCYLLWQVYIAISRVSACMHACMHA